MMYLCNEIDPLRVLLFTFMAWLILSIVVIPQLLM